MARVYLGVYNALQSFGWSLLLLRQLKSGFKDVDLQFAYFLQLAALLEVLHSAFGLVRSGTLTAFMQWGGRFHVIAAIATQIEEVQSSPFLQTMLLAWAISEVIRYPHYLCSILGMCPAWLTWLRYTAFIPLYPIGFSSEMALMYAALPAIKERNVHGEYFKWMPFDYHTFIVVLLLIYPGMASVLYTHMLSQRRAKLGSRFKVS